VLGRIGPLWPEAVELARAIAVLDTDAELRHAAAIAGIDLDQAVEAADALTTARVLAPGRPLHFVHPILRQAVYEDLPAGRRADAHARAARILDGEGGDPDRAVVHLLASEPAADQWVVEHLQAGAERAVARGAPVTASAYLRRALAEPPDGGRRIAVLFELGRAARASGEPDALTLLEAVLGEAEDPALRAGAAEELAWALLLNGEFERAPELLAREADRIGERDWQARLMLEVAHDLMSIWNDETAGRSAARIDALLSKVTGETPTERLILSAAAGHRTMTMSGSASEILELARRATADDMIVTETPAVSLGWMGAMDGFIANDRLDLADELFDSVLANARRNGSRAMTEIAWSQRARQAHLRGELRETVDGMRVVLDSGLQLGPVMTYGAAMWATIALLQRGEPDEAGALLAQLGFDEAEIGPTPTGRMLLVARAYVRAAAGRQADAIADAREAARRTAARGGSLLLHLGLTGSMALALHGVGAPHDEAVAEARRELALAERVGAPSAIGNATVALALIEGGEQMIARLERAVGLLEPSPRRLDCARALVELGAALRRANRRAEARALLNRGMDIAHRCGARPLAERAREELKACGARPRRLLVTGIDALTASERRVAMMAGDGMTNTDIAQALFITRKTVETHLGRVYVKLGIRSRAELPAALVSASGT
jgi:DNA-binding CsgD family transcriptional regulator